MITGQKVKIIKEGLWTNMEGHITAVKAGKYLVHFKEVGLYFNLEDLEAVGEQPKQKDKVSIAIIGCKKI